MVPVRQIHGGTISRLAAFPRLLIEITIGPTSGHNFFTGLSMSLADGGVFIATHAAMKLDSLVELHVTLPNETLPIVTLARVCMALPYSSDDIDPGYVCAFVDIDKAALAPIRRFIAYVRAPLFFDVD